LQTSTFCKSVSSTVGGRPERPKQTMRSADTPKTRELAQWLLAYEFSEAKAANADALGASRVCDQLRRPLTTLAGAAGFRSLLARALILAQQECPAFGAWAVKPDGSLESLNGETEQSGSVLIAHLIGLMITLIGESFTLRLLHDVWRDLPDSEVEFEKDKLK
jgi:hypothetical protein